MKISQLNQSEICYKTVLKLLKRTNQLFILFLSSYNPVIRAASILSVQKQKKSIRELSRLSPGNGLGRSEMKFERVWTDIWREIAS